MSYRDPEFLRLQMRSIISFYHPVCLDRELGGYINQLRDDGTVFDRWTKHLVGTCRFIYIYSLAALVWNQAEHREAAVHGLRFLQERHRQPDGGFAWELKGLEVADGTRQCYGHAFVLLAAAGATKAGLQGASSLIDEVFNLLENRFWEAEARLYVDEIDADDWNSIAPYRGQNANMHMCEAMLAAFEATGQDRFLARSHLLAKRICLDLADRARWSDLGALPNGLDARLGLQPGQFQRHVPALRLSVRPLRGMGQAAADSGAISARRLDAGKSPTAI